jgi:general secretion pathway protein D
MCCLHSEVVKPFPALYKTRASICIGGRAPQLEEEEMRHPALTRGSVAFALAAAFLVAGCDLPVEGDGAVANHLRGVALRTPAETARQPGAPLPVAPGAATARPAPAQAQLFFGADPVGAGARRGAAQDPTGGVRLNFDGASLREVVDVILGEVLGVNYTIDPAVDGTVILSSTAALSQADLLNVLETVLQMHGATLVDLGGTYAVLAGQPVVGAAQIAPVGGETAPPLIVGTGVTIVPLRYVSAGAAAQFIQPLLSLPEQIRVDDSRNLVLFVGTAAERQNVVRTLGEIDVDWMAGRSVGIFPLRTATPEAVILELEGLFTPLDPFATQAAGVRFLPMSRLNAVLAITAQPDQLVEIERWVQRLDRGSGASVQFFVYQLQHTPATEMAALLNESFGDAGGSGDAQALAPIGFDQGFPDDLGLAPDDPLLPAFPGAAPAGRGNLLDNVKVVADTTANALVIRATPQAYELIEQTIRRLDRAPLQVLIEATIAEVVLNDLLRFGVQYYFDAGGVQGGFNTSGAGLAGAGGGLLTPLGQLPGFNFIISGGSSNVTIDALSRITDVQVLSSPSLVVQDNSEAVLTVGDEVPLITRTTQGIENPDAPVVANIEYRETGVILEVRPRINTNNVVTLEISQEVSRVQQPDQARRDENPIIVQRRIASKVNVTSGQTVVLGGLIQDSTLQSSEKVPLLGDIPVLGNLFRSQRDENVRTELIVFITPRVIRNAEDARDISEELRSRMRAAHPGAGPRAAAPLPGPAADPLLPAPDALPEPPRVAPRPLTTSRLADPAPVGSAAPREIVEPADDLPAGIATIGFTDDALPVPLARPVPGNLGRPFARPSRAGVDT